MRTKEFVITVFLSCLWRRAAAVVAGGGAQSRGGLRAALLPPPSLLPPPPPSVSDVTAHTNHVTTGAPYADDGMRHQFAPPRRPGGPCCHNGGTCVMGVFCSCPKAWTGFRCETSVASITRPCGPVPHQHWARLDCRLCLCHDSRLSCLGRVYAGCREPDVISVGAAVDPARYPDLTVLPYAEYDDFSGDDDDEDYADYAEYLNSRGLNHHHQSSSGGESLVVKRRLWLGRMNSNRLLLFMSGCPALWLSLAVTRSFLSAFVS